MLQIIQPGLVGLMDGSVSTLADDGKTSSRGAPYLRGLVCAGAGPRGGVRDAQFLERFQVGAAASIGAGISRGFAEAGLGRRGSVIPSPI